MSELLLAGSFLVYIIALVLPALTVQHIAGGRSWVLTLTGAEALRSGARLLLHLGGGRDLHFTTMTLALGALNLIPVGALALWRLQGRRLSHILPVVALLAGFALWSMLPSSPEAVAAARESWLIQPGYHVWLWSLAGMSLAVGMQWKSRVMLHAIWSKRATANTCGWALDEKQLVYLPVAVRSLCRGAHRLRQSLEQNPLGEDATHHAWEWRRAALALSEVDRAAVEDHNVQLRAAELAMQRFWDADADASLRPLAEMDVALDHFLATATAPPKCTAFR